MNQQCGRYGKLLCSACIVEVPQMGDRSQHVLIEEGRHVRIIPGSGIGGNFVIVVGVGIVVGIDFNLPWPVGIVGGTVLAIILAVWMISLTESL